MLCTVRSKKQTNQKKESKGFHNHATLITMVPGKFHLLDTTQSSEMSGIFLPIHYVHVHQVWAERDQMTCWQLALLLGEPQEVTPKKWRACQQTKDQRPMLSQPKKCQLIDKSNLSLHVHDKYGACSVTHHKLFWVSWHNMYRVDCDVCCHTTY